MEVTKKMMIADIIRSKPESVKIMFENGLHCIGCRIATTESLEDGAKAHGLNDDQINEMVKSINDLEK